VKLFSRKYGSGEPVIILYGLLGISDNWVTHAKRLAEKYQVLFLTSEITDSRHIVANLTNKIWYHFQFCRDKLL